MQITYNTLSKSLLLALVTVVLIFSVSLALATQKQASLLEQSKKVVGQSSALDKWVTEKTGEYVPLDATFVDENNRQIQLKDFIDRPTILLPIYYYCPNICSKNLANLAVALGSLSYEPGTDYRVVALSFNEAETYKEAKGAKANYLKILDESFPEKEWLFLTGTLENIRAVTDSVGFKFKKIEGEGTFIHPAALIAIGGDGKIIRYVYGSFLAGDIDMALQSAKSGKPSLSVKRILAFCFNYDPNKNKSVFQEVKIGVILFFVALVGFVLFFKRKKKVIL